MLNLRWPRPRSILPFLVLSLLPGLALAEVSVQIDHQTGAVKRVFYLVRSRGARPIVWAQVRPGVPQNQLLNPQGDVTGDLAPVIRLHPQTGNPWAVWPMRVANQYQVGVSYWTGTGWSPTQRIVTAPDPYYYDEVQPSFTFDFAGNPFVVWERAEPTHQILFSTLMGGVWTPPLLLSDPSLDSRGPSIEMDGARARISYATPTGTVTLTYDTTALLSAAASLMDTPIPPGHNKGGGDTSGGTDSGGGSGGGKVRK